MKKRVTSRDVAKSAGVSQSLVSLILNDVPGKKINPGTRKKVLETAKELNYTININARNMKNRKAGAIGLLSSWDTGSFVFPPVIKGIQSVCSENDLGVVICTGKKDPSGNPDFIQYFHQNRIDGLIFVSYVGITREGVIDELIKHGIPFVCIIGARDIPGVSCVDVNFIESGYLAVKHLARKGYKNIAYILPHTMEVLQYGETERLEGCMKAASELGINIKIIDKLTGIETEEKYLEAACKFLKNMDFDAIIAISFPCFMILKAAAHLGIKVPDLLGVISLDNEAYAPYLSPSLTTIDEPLFDIAKRATNILIENMEGKKNCSKVELPPLLSVRESTDKKRTTD